MRMRAPVSTAIAIAVGTIILLGYFVPLALLQNIRVLLLGWAVALLGVATLVGILNMVGVHWRRIRSEEKRDYYSVIFLLAFMVTLIFGLWRSPSDPTFQKAVTSIQAPVATTLMALLAVSLAYSSLRLLQKQQGVMAVIFLISALVFLVLLSGYLPLSSDVPVLNSALGFLNRLPLAGARGILLGVALGSLTTGLRILLGADRPYSG